MAHDDHVHGPDCDHDHDHDHGGGLAVSTALEDLGPCKKLLRVEVPSDAVQKEIQTRIQHLRKSVHLKGFRKGKAPLSRIERLYGDAVERDAREAMVREGYMKALETSKLGAENVLGEGTIENVDFSKEEGLKFEVTLHTRPEFETPEYKGISVTVPKLEVQDKDIEDAITNFRRSRGEMKPVEGEGAVVEGEDLVSVDLQVWLADEYETFAKAEEAGEDTSHLKFLKEEFGFEVQLPYGRLGSYDTEDLVDSLTGLKIGEWGETETDLPDDFEVTEGRGEPAVIRLRVEAIRRLMLPELTEEWVKESGYETIADLRREVRDELQQQQDVIKRKNIEASVVANLLDAAGEFALPSDLVDAEIESAERRRTFELRMQGKSEQEAENAVADEREEINVEVRKMLRSYFLVDRIARAEKISVSERDVDGRIVRLAAAHGQNPKDMREQLEKQRIMGQLRQDILDEKVRAFLRDHADVTESEDI
jgi:trigger factor